MVFFGPFCRPKALEHDLSIRSSIYCTSSRTAAWHTTKTCIPQNPAPMTHFLASTPTTPYTFP
ncbi:hypothetical protein CY34DRAFT_712552 [Suillus luteus UH-Slu-Lm8-n1]|uniref:Uncharacterized protein n=1 Tax=Suillus luteus UH-Slu-Lm8-n1 TaxID=930992 RepID=A0A0D0ANM2_9AGAM|nr:hypothetical protein CY34DRAFT_712552 [Suillus luteus UH-Slu-Lm8-n1]